MPKSSKSKTEAAKGKKDKKDSLADGALSSGRPIDNSGDDGVPESSSAGTDVMPLRLQIGDNSITADPQTENSMTTSTVVDGQRTFTAQTRAFLKTKSTEEIESIMITKLERIAMHPNESYRHTYADNLAASMHEQPSKTIGMGERLNTYAAGAGSAGKIWVKEVEEKLASLTLSRRTEAATPSQHDNSSADTVDLDAEMGGSQLDTVETNAADLLDSAKLTMNSLEKSLASTRAILNEVGKIGSPSVPDRHSGSGV